jgi:hypothetical protein
LSVLHHPASQAATRGFGMKFFSLNNIVALSFAISSGFLISNICTVNQHAMGLIVFLVQYGITLVLRKLELIIDYLKIEEK